ncbi:hypothetical protein [Nocardia callitridis]|uniref:Uncharacterized protein n=1 Tax=Nocardia callitridis TaxID=648753 RepID=A0ABP9KIA5_9NOCA
MPKRISDVSLHVYVTPETLERLVAGVRDLLDEHLAERDVFAWRFTLPVDAEDPEHLALETQWHTNHPETDTGERRTYEIALSLVGDPTELTDDTMAELEYQLLHGIYGNAVPGQEIPLSMHAIRRSDVDLDLDADRERI